MTTNHVLESAPAGDRPDSGRLLSVEDLRTTIHTPAVTSRPSTA